MSLLLDNIRKRMVPDVTILPIVTRELRVAARRPKTYSARTRLALGWTVMGAYVLLGFSATGIGKGSGQTLFTTVSYMMVCWAVVSAWTGCDSISVEKREGTIGLLFLTDLKSHDIVLGKLAACALPSLYGALAAVPLLAISMVLGGVSPALYAKTGVALLNMVFFFQAAGIFASALCRLRRNATNVVLLIVLVYLVCFDLASKWMEKMGWGWLGSLLWVSNGTP